MKNLSEPKIAGIDAVRTAQPSPLRAGVLLPAKINATDYGKKTKTTITMKQRLSTNSFTIRSFIRHH